MEVGEEVGGGLLLVAVILLFEFGDWRAPFLTVIMALTVLTSVLGSLILTGMTLNISSFVGAIMMVGIVGEKAVFLIHDAREELLRGMTEILGLTLCGVRRAQPEHRADPPRGEGAGGRGAAEAARRPPGSTSREADTRRAPSAAAGGPTAAA